MEQVTAPTKTITSDTKSRMTVGVSCQICNSFIPIYHPSQSAFPICLECRKRMKKILYPEEET